MIWLVLGVLIWSVVHPLRSVAATPRQRLIERFGESGYKGFFTLAIVTSLVLMVVGWRATPPTMLYRPPAWGHSAALPLMLLALMLFAASGVPTNIKRVIRHPQLSGVLVWALAHLLSNGDLRSLVLFGGLGAWALVEMPLINRREGARRAPAALPWSADAKPRVAAVVVYVVLFFAHPYLFGVSPMGM